MRITLGQLRQIVREGLREGVRSPEEVILSDGEAATYASDDHINDMKTTLAGLESLKKQHKYGTAARASFANASFYLKRFLKRAMESGDRIDEPEEAEEPRTFSQLEDGRPPEARDPTGSKPSGYSRNANPIPVEPGVAMRK